MVSQERTEWHRIVLFGKLAEIAANYIKKGDLVYFEGQIQTRKWVDKSGQDRFSTEIVVPYIGGVMQMLGTPKGKSETNTISGSIKKTEEFFGSSIKDYDDIPF